jgi:uracil-DNA glycosylase
MSAETWVPVGAGVDELRQAAEACRGCELWEPATQVVFSAGNPAGALMLVGEQPGDQEDRRGIPFVGPAGQLLQRALAEAGVAVGDVYVTPSSISGSPNAASGGSTPLPRSPTSRRAGPGSRPRSTPWTPR